MIKLELTIDDVLCKLPHTTTCFADSNGNIKLYTDGQTEYFLIESSLNQLDIIYETYDEGDDVVFEFKLEYVMNTCPNFYNNNIQMYLHNLENYNKNKK